MEINQQARLRELQKKSSGIHSFYTPKAHDDITCGDSGDEKVDRDEVSKEPTIFKFFDNQVNSEEMQEKARRNRELQEQVQQQFNSLSNIATRFLPFGNKQERQNAEKDLQEQADASTSKSSDVQQETPDSEASASSSVHVQRKPQIQLEKEHGTKDLSGNSKGFAEVLEKQKDAEKLQSVENGMETSKVEVVLEKEEQKQCSNGGISAFYNKKSNSTEHADQQNSQVEQFQKLLNVSSVLSFFGQKSTQLDKDASTAGSSSQSDKDGTASVAPAATSADSASVVSSGDAIDVKPKSESVPESNTTAEKKK